MTVEFSVLNASSKTIELLPPQIQLAGKSNEKHKKTVKADPVPVKDYTMTIRRRYASRHHLESCDEHKF